MFWVSPNLAKYPYMDDHHLNNITKLGKKKKNTESGLGVESKSVFGLALGRYISGMEMGIKLEQGWYYHKSLPSW